MKNTDVDPKGSPDLSHAQLTALAQKKIFFGHQSVGYNIVEGIQEIAAKHPGGRAITIKETNSSGDFSAPVFAHSKVGINKNPFSKIDDFKRLMDSGLGKKVDIAFFKLCYIDVEQKTDINKLFSYYREAMDYLGQKYPNVVFIHMTVPIRALSTGMKARIKRKLGLYVWGDDDNIQREKYNSLMRQHYGRDKRLFDLASFETKNASGEINGLKLRNVFVPALRAEYTADGGHLNMEGKGVVAGNLLRFLASL